MCMCFWLGFAVCLSSLSSSLSILQITAGHTRQKGNSNDTPRDFFFKIRDEIQSNSSFWCLNPLFSSYSASKALYLCSVCLSTVFPIETMFDINFWLLDCLFLMYKPWPIFLLSRTSFQAYFELPIHHSKPLSDAFSPWNILMFEFIWIL